MCFHADELLLTTFFSFSLSLSYNTKENYLLFLLLLMHACPIAKFNEFLLLRGERGRMKLQFCRDQWTLLLALLITPCLFPHEIWRNCWILICQSLDSITKTVSNDARNPKPFTCDDWATFSADFSHFLSRSRGKHSALSSSLLRSFT